MASHSSLESPFNFKPNSTFFFTVSHGNNAYCWKTTPLSVPVPLIGFPSTKICPLVGSNNPAIIFNNVDLPHPDGPITQINSFSLISKSTPFKATTSPFRVLYFFSTP